MNTAEYHAMAELEDTYWWHVGRKYIVDHQLEWMLPKESNGAILNIGSGTGGMVPILERYGEVTNVDSSKEAIAFLKKKNIKNLHEADATNLPFPDNHFDAVVALDVLEHIEDDDAALREWRRVVKPGGSLLLTVPAYRWLWSGHDESLHHYRRYRASKLHKKLNHANYLVTKSSYAIVFSFPLIVGFRVLEKIMRPKKQETSYVMLPSPVNRFFIFLLRVEGWIIQYLNFPFGTSVLIRARKIG